MHKSYFVKCVAKVLSLLRLSLSLGTRLVDSDPVGRVTPVWPNSFLVWGKDVEKSPKKDVFIYSELELDNYYSKFRRWLTTWP